MFKKINWRYAIGEIIIVIIGITIAFTLNKWAENSKNRASKKEYLSSLLIDIDSEIAHLQANIGQFQVKIKDVEQMFPYFAGRQDGRDTIAQKIFELAEIVYFKPNDATYKTLVNSGDLGLFKDFELRKQLESHYSDHQIIQVDYDRQNKIHENYFGDFMIREIDYNAMRQGNYSFIDKPLLKSIVQSLYGTFLIAIETSKKGIERCQQLKTNLEKALRKH